MSRTIRSAFAVEKPVRRAEVSPSVRARRKPDVPVGPSRAARMLALAHHVERLVEAGELSGYAEAARALGVTRARMTQVMKLVLLAPEVQRRVVTGEMPATERALRGLVQAPEWCRQAS